MDISWFDSIGSSIEYFVIWNFQLNRINWYRFWKFQLNLRSNIKSISSSYKNMSFESTHHTTQLTNSKKFKNSNVQSNRTIWLDSQLIRLTKTDSTNPNIWYHLIRVKSDQIGLQSNPSFKDPPPYPENFKQCFYTKPHQKKTLHISETTKKCYVSRGNFLYPFMKIVVFSQSHCLKSTKINNSIDCIW